MFYSRTPEEIIRSHCEAIGLNYIGTDYGSITYVRFVCGKHDYKGIQKINREALERWYTHGECKCALVHRDEEDLRREPTLNKNVEIIDKYVKSNIKIECRCRQCGKEWSATPNKLQQGEGCPDCRWTTISEKNAKAHDEFVNDVRNRYPDIEIIGTYTNANSPIAFRCGICGKTQTAASAHRLLSGVRGCSFCCRSKGERLVASCLDSLDIQYETQKTFSECRSKQELRFDFFLPQLNTCIEYQGEQHYMPVRFRKSCTEHDVMMNYKGQIERDNIKRKFCADNGIKLIEVPYWEFANTREIITEQIMSSLNNETVETVTPKQ